MKRPFGQILARALVRNGLSQRDFARQVRTSGVFVSMLIRGKRRAPLSSVDRWAGVLKLSGADRREFSLQAQLTHCPLAIRRLVTRLRCQVVRGEAATRRAPRASGIDQHSG